MELYFLLFSVLPILLMSILFYLLLQKFFNEEREKRSHQFKTLQSKEFLPQKYQAYERIALFLERIRPTSLASRIEPNGTKSSYEYMLVHSIQQEFDHNLSQQIYIHPETWKIVFSSKNATINFIKKCSEGISSEATAQELQQEIITRSIQEVSPSTQAILYLQKDIQGN